jgi:taurine--2-oxoglutarate transaminase
LIKQSLEEWTPVPVERVEGCYIITPDGRKILDFLSRLISVNAGQKQPRVIEAIKQALDRYGYVWEVMQTPYKSLAAKLIVEDILGKDGWAGKDSQAQVARLTKRLLL